MVVSIRLVTMQVLLPNMGNDATSAATARYNTTIPNPNPNPKLSTYQS